MSVCSVDAAPDAGLDAVDIGSFAEVATAPVAVVGRDLLAVTVAVAEIVDRNAVAGLTAADSGRDPDFSILVQLLLLLLQLLQSPLLRDRFDGNYCHAALRSTADTNAHWRNSSEGYSCMLISWLFCLYQCCTRCCVSQRQSQTACHFLSVILS